MENMENLEQEQNQEVNNEGNQEQQPIESQEANATNEGVTGTETVNQDTNLEAWQKDGRYGKMWKTHDDVYNSYKSLETNFQDVNAKHKALIKVLKDNGFQAETLADELKKYEDWRNPESRQNQVFNYIEKWLKNEMYSPRIQQFFSQLEQEELQRLYPNMSAEQIKKQQELEARVNKFEAEARQREQQAFLEQDVASINKGMAECEELAKEYGFRMTKEVKDYLFAHCSKNNIDPRYIKNEFWNIFGKQMLDARDKKTITNYSARKQKIKDAQIVSGGGSKVGNFAPTGDAKSKLKATFERILGKK
ncbi:MAG: hypothetical protein K5622_07295 [Endomicrobiaceae bacterium]|nr:hypothetical protein [Endomicrobiaceae bacterium]